MTHVQRAARRGRALAAVGIGLALAASGAAAPAAAEEPDGGPALCAMVEAFDAALQRRFYRANLAPERPECHFVSAEGCPYRIGRLVVIRVTHARREGCAPDGDCALTARQVCAPAEPGADCLRIMNGDDASYVVSGRFEERAGRLRLDDWTREPTTTLGQDETALAVACPSLWAPPDAAPG